ncbi:MAG: prepilin-type N-terminal cleavage/methylation domain-containing protein [Phycisphaerae bacterium]|nr:prepilin-type N-terminal cleavage/methylation domain-containing protein [Phycisphaerae bacterium]
MDRRRRPCRDAYTLIELMAVVFVISLVSGLVFVNADAITPRFKADKAAAEVAAHLRTARSQAILQQKVVRLELYPEDHRILYFYEDPAAQWSQDAPADAGEEQPFAQNQWDASMLLDRSIIGADDVLDQQTVILRFWPTGVCTPVRLLMRFKNNAELKRTVRLNPLTGLTTIVKGYETPQEYELKINAPGRRM